jgi:hypothetical protein
VTRLALVNVNALAFVSVLTLWPMAALASPPPRLVNASVQTRPAAGLVAAARQWAAGQREPGWLGYEVPATGGHEMCCFDSFDGVGASASAGGCRIEKHGSFSMRDQGERIAEMDADTAVILLRAEEGRIGRIRVLSRGCGIDAGGRSLTWLEGAAPAESLGLLATLVGDGGDDGAGRHDKLGHGALMAIAVHEGPAADETLDDFLKPPRPVEVRKQAAFWMGNLRGRHGYESLRRVLREDPSDEVRAHAVFALTQSPVPEAVDAMIAAARQDASAHVRGQALFWLGQKAGRKAVSAIARALDEDPETEVKKKAVFALSQLPREEGVPRLIEVARHNRNPAVRKQAMFWLGQSGDARALAFFEEVLGRP